MKTNWQTKKLQKARGVVNDDMSQYNIKEIVKFNIK